MESWSNKKWVEEWTGSCAGGQTNKLQTSAQESLLKKECHKNTNE